MNKSLSTRLMYSFMALIVVIVVGVTAGISYLIADYFFSRIKRAGAGAKMVMKWLKPLNILCCVILIEQRCTAI